ncbi:MAG: metallophosphoesterase, partial [Chloroflexi bacterium]|nr:metallophosphoesterase [Chloroflexota bacterium]
MKLAVLADIHSNWRALQAVADHIEQWQPDRVVVAGDVINRGPRPVECADFILARGWAWVRGNHEEYVLSHVP